MELLLSYNAEIDISDIKAQTPLAAAVKNKHLGCVRHLVEAGANPDGDRQNLSSPLYLAAMMGDLAIVQVLPDFFICVVIFLSRTNGGNNVEIHVDFCCRQVIISTQRPPTKDYILQTEFSNVFS